MSNAQPNLHSHKCNWAHSPISICSCWAAACLAGMKLKHFLSMQEILTLQGQREE